MVISRTAGAGPAEVLLRNIIDPSLASADTFRRSMVKGQDRMRDVIGALVK